MMEPTYMIVNPASIVRLQDELAALRAWRERAVLLLRAFVAEAMEYGEDQPWCMHCIQSESEGHAPTCPVTLARALLRESEESDADRV